MGYGPLVRAAVGITRLWTSGDGGFYDATTIFPDHIAARITAIAALAGLIRRHRIGTGAHVDISHGEAGMNQLATTYVTEAARAAALPVTDNPGGHGVYRCSGEDEWCVISIRSDADRVALTAVMGEPDLPRDRALAEARGVDCLFVPEAGAMYPHELLARVVPGPVAETLEGMARPGHFTGVLTVVAKLFHIVEPDVAVFGRKDFQQAMLVRRLVQDLDFPVTIDIAPTVRELDGLALSSRNSYLSSDERRSALVLSRALRTLEQTWRAGEADPAKLQRAGLEAMHAPGVIPEYCALVDEDLQPVTRLTARTVAVVAARVGKTRLLDNVVLGEGIGADPRVTP